MKDYLQQTRGKLRTVVREDWELEAPPAVRALGFLAGPGTIQADLKTAFADDIAAMFGAPR